ncbi:MAG: YraN family protein [Chloroflexota bacterium]|nr:YraN family protein [Chloroflexota bacterium]
MTRHDRAALGRAGEGHARRFLEVRGFAFVEANWHCPDGELDLVMRDGEELVFVEVKLRWGEAAGRPDDAVTRAKARRLLVAAETYVAEHTEWHAVIWRIDLIAISLRVDGAVDATRYYENAIGS